MLNQVFLHSATHSGAKKWQNTETLYNVTVWKFQLFNCELWTQIKMGLFFFYLSLSFFGRINESYLGRFPVTRDQDQTLPSSGSDPANLVQVVSLIRWKQSYKLQDSTNTIKLCHYLVPRFLVIQSKKDHWGGFFPCPSKKENGIINNTSFVFFLLLCKIVVTMVWLWLMFIEKWLCILRNIVQ